MEYSLYAKIFTNCWPNQIQLFILQMLLFTSLQLWQNKSMIDEQIVYISLET